MTVHIVISLVFIALFIWSLQRLTTSSDPRSPSPWGLTWAMNLLALPVSFAPIVPLSHFVFEATSDNVLWFAIIFVPLWILSGLLLWKYNKIKSHKLAPSFAYTIIWCVLCFWGCLGVMLSQYEPGTKTPGLADAPIYIAHWISIQIVMLCLFYMLLIHARHYRSIKHMIFITLLFMAYISIAYMPLIGQ